MLGIKIIVLILIFAFTMINGSYIYIGNKTGNGIYINTPYLYPSPVYYKFNVTSFMAMLGNDVKGLQNCGKVDSNTSSFLRGNIVVVAPDGGCTIPQHVLVAQNAGAVGVVVLTPALFLGSNYIQDSNQKLKIPVVFMDPTIFFKYANTTTLTKGIMMDMIGDKSDIQLLNMGGVVFYQITGMTMNLMGCILMMSQLIRFYKIEDAIITVSKLVFIMSFLSCILCMIFLIDPWSYWHKIQYYSYIMIVPNLFDYFATISILLVTFHFSKFLIKFLRNIKFMIPIYVIVILMMIGYTLITIMSLYYTLIFNYPKSDSLAIGSFRVFLFGLIAIYFTICAISLFRILREVYGSSIGSDKDLRKQRRYKRLLYCISCLIFVNIIFIILRSLLLIDKYVFKALTLFILFGFITIIPFVISVCYFFLFHPTQKKKIENSGNNNNNNNNFHEKRSNDHKDDNSMKIIEEPIIKRIELI